MLQFTVDQLHVTARSRPSVNFDLCISAGLAGGRAAQKVYQQ